MYNQMCGAPSPLDLPFESHFSRRSPQSPVMDRHTTIFCRNILTPVYPRVFPNKAVVKISPKNLCGHVYIYIYILYKHLDRDVPIYRMQVKRVMRIIYWCQPCWQCHLQFAVQVLVSDSTAGLLEEVRTNGWSSAESQNFGFRALKIFEIIVIW